MNKRHETHGRANMEKDRNPNAAEIALPLNAFPVQSRFREKKKINDLVAVIISISISIPAPKTKKSRTSASVMEKNRNPDAAEIALPLNAFPVQSGLERRERTMI